MPVVRVLLVAAAAVSLSLAALALSRYPEEHPVEALWTALFGEADLGPVDFNRLKRRSTPNDALICPADLCPATADGQPPVYLVSEERLRAALAAFALAEPGVSLVYRLDGPGRAFQDRYIARSRLLRFPDTVSVLFIPLSETSSTLAIYSRSQIGRGDMGVNLARVRRWTDPANLGLPAAQP
jgi:hypothetical protein